METKMIHFNCFSDAFMRFDAIILHVPLGFLLAVYCFCKLVILIVINKKNRMLVAEKYSNNKYFRVLTLLCSMFL
jgi:hypothetical protein